MYIFLGPLSTRPRAPKCQSTIDQKKRASTQGQASKLAKPLPIHPPANQRTSELVLPKE